MAVPFDDATTWLSDQSAMIRQFYRENFAKMHNRFGRTLNRHFKTSKRKIDGDGIVVQVMDGLLYGARMNRDLNADFPTPRTFGSKTYKVTVSESPSANDMRRCAISLQVTHNDVKRAYSKKVSSDDFMALMIKGATDNIMETIALHRYLGKDAKVGKLSTTTPVKNDTRLISTGALLAATGGARFTLQAGQIAAFPRNLVLDVYDSSPIIQRAFKLSVTDYNPRDGSVGTFGLDANGAPSTAVDVSTIQASDDLYISGEKDEGLMSLGEWFPSTEPASGDSFFGRDRSDPNYRWMLPHKSGPLTATTFNKTHIDDAFTELGFIEEDPDSAYTALTEPALEQKYRTEIGDDVLIQFPSDEQKGKLIAQYGFDGNMYRHPNAGRIVLIADPLHPKNKMRFLKVGDWETEFIGDESLEWLPGDTGGWYRMNSSTPGGGRTTTYRMDGMLAMADVCLMPRRQIEVENITPN